MLEVLLCAEANYPWMWWIAVEITSLEGTARGHRLSPMLMSQRFH